MSRPVPILAIDTSTDHAGIAVLGEDTRVSLSWFAGRNQTTSVLDQVDRCLGLASVPLASLGGIAVAKGPGMFTSLRVGMSIAKGLALGIDLPVIGISTALVTATPWLGLDRGVVSVVSVGRGRVVWQSFGSEGDSRDEPTNGSLDDLLGAIAHDPEALIVGEFPDALAQDERLVGQVVRSGNDVRRDPLVLARLGFDRLTLHGPDDLMLLEPAYVHSRSQSATGV
jgi:tRNA threonylcarbamoyladenosine biosynthesis protein TsaB